jgi:gamma-glutamyltranspeptidase / glutathione hydrolase
MKRMSQGLVVTAHQAAADAGASALAAGGTAVDAAVAAGFALCVVDPANCGLGGYGGFLLYAPPTGTPVGVGFNTWAPARLDPAFLRVPGAVSDFVEGGASVAPPAVVPGLLATHDAFGRLALADLIAPSVRLAADGFTVGFSAALALRQHWERTGGGEPEFARIFYPDGAPPEQGSRLVQTDLAGTLESVAAAGVDAFRNGALVEAICSAVEADGGFLEPSDFAEDRVTIGPGETVAFESAVVYGASRATSGAGLVFAALEAIDFGRLGPNREEAYIEELGRALRAAWADRAGSAEAGLDARHTTHLCTADADGGMVALTFTHGPWCGSGIVARGTGILLNGGANLFAPGDEGPLAVTNMSPVILDVNDGDRHALGATGGPRIPAFVLTSIVDVAHYGSSLSDALAAPHLAIRVADGELEVEPPLARFARADVKPLQAGDGFGPAFGITRLPGEWAPALDPRFEHGLARG